MIFARSAKEQKDHPQKFVEEISNLMNKYISIYFMTIILQNLDLLLTGRREGILRNAGLALGVFAWERNLLLHFLRITVPSKFSMST